jgi:hypothetical protein
MFVLVEWASLPAANEASPDKGVAKDTHFGNEGCYYSGCSCVRLSWLQEQGEK